LSRADFTLSALAIIATVTVCVIDNASTSESIKEVPSWVVTEKDLDLYLAGKTVVQHDTANVKLQRAAQPDELSGEETGLLQMGADSEAAPEESTDFMEVPKWVTSEEDMDAYLKKQGLKQVHKVSATSSKNEEQAKKAMDDINEWLKNDPKKAANDESDEIDPALGLEEIGSWSASRAW
jgi:hypothetical protein